MALWRRRRPGPPSVCVRQLSRVTSGSHCTLQAVHKQGAPRPAGVPASGARREGPRGVPRARASLPCGSPHVARCGWLASPWPRGDHGIAAPSRLLENEPPPAAAPALRPPGGFRRGRCGVAGTAASCPGSAGPARHTWAERRGGLSALSSPGVLQGLHLAAEVGWHCVGWVGTGTPWPRLCLTRPSKAAFVTGEDGLLGESKRRNWETGPGWAG